MLNRVTLIGRVGKDPETRKINEKTSVSSISLATTETYKDDKGERKEITEWHKVIFWEGLSNIVEKWVKKGMLLYIEGKLVTRSWEKDGTKHYSTEVVARDMKFLESKKEESKPAEIPTPEFNTTPQPDDLPF